MTGPEHYREAERLLGEAQSKGADLLQRLAESGGNPAALATAAQTHGNLFAAAQAHATLALAAATVAARLVGPQEMWGGHTVEVPDSDGWREVTG